MSPQALQKMKRNVILLSLSQAMLITGTSLLLASSALVGMTFIVFSTVTLTAFSSGAVQNILGWKTINMAVIPFLLLIALANF